MTGTVLFLVAWVAFATVYVQASNRWPALDLVAAAFSAVVAVAGVLGRDWIIAAFSTVCMFVWLFYARRDYTRRALTQGDAK